LPEENLRGKKITTLTVSTRPTNGEKMKIRIIAILTAIYLLLPIHAFAEVRLTDKYTDSELVQIIKDEGYSGVKKLRDGVIRIKVEGKSYILINKDDGDLQAYYGIGGVKVSYKDINKWNKTRRLSRAYLDSDEDPVLESDLLANGGLSVEHVTEFFRVFKISVQSFREFIIENDKS
jgi:frataxin-like iron-binding protein CyaY